MRSVFGSIREVTILAACTLLMAGCGDGSAQPKPGEKPSANGANAAAAKPECKGAVFPSNETIESGEYTPLARPLFLYVSKKALQRAEVAAFLKFYLGEGQSVITEVKSIPLPAGELQKSKAALDAAIDTQAAGELAGTITIDGSSTVFPITQTMAEDFEKAHPNVKIGVGKSGTGGGFKKFVLGETDISDASRPITDSEKAKCQEHGVEYVELKIAIDGISVVVNPKNTWCDCISIEQLQAIWEPSSKIKKWSDINPAWPNEAIELYAPDPDSGTYDYFAEVVCKGKATRQDYQPNSEDQVLVQGVAGDRNALGYFGYAYYEPNKSQLKVLGIIPPQGDK
ncbi:MAG TPA: phosphate ABC transporter substrate-binding protein PstS family protein [Planctomycetaceae bacterium]|nr:phosphate ABC transporter substrate-binding protein PstS family protein [Planctomycetaceae bacterium]